MSPRAACYRRNLPPTSEQMVGRETKQKKKHEQKTPDDGIVRWLAKNGLIATDKVIVVINKKSSKKKQRKTKRKEKKGSSSSSSSDSSSDSDSDSDSSSE